MNEIKVKFDAKNYALIKPRLAGIYFLIQEEEVIFIGESKDIKRQLAKLVKKGVQFDTIGISPFKGSTKQRRGFAQGLIRKYRPKNNKIPKSRPSPTPSQRGQKPKQSAPSTKPERKPAPPPKRKKRRLRGKPAREVTLPQSRLDLIKPASTDELAEQTETDAGVTEQPPSPVQDGGGTEQETSGQTVPEQIAQDQFDEDTKPEKIELDHSDQFSEEGTRFISPEARESLIQWTKKLTTEAYEEMNTEAPPPQLAEDSADLPDWVDNLANETWPGDVPPQQDRLKQDAEEIAPRPEQEATLREWSPGPSPTVGKPQEEETPLKQEEEETEEELPEWLNDIDTDKPRGKSVSPFG